MKKFVFAGLAGILALSMASAAVAGETANTPVTMPSGLTLMGQTGYNPDHGGTASTGIIAMYRGIGGGLYIGGDHSDNRGGGVGGDLRIDSSLIGMGLSYGKQHTITAYGEAGIAWQQGVFKKIGPALTPLEISLGRTQPTQQLADDKISFEGGGGLTYNYHLNDRYGLAWSLGYHTSKGINTGFGVTFW